MRRRDELQARQNVLRDSEDGKAEQQSQGGWPHWLNSNSNATADGEEMNDKMARDIPLYSPVTKSLFAHLRAAKEDRWSGSVEWKPVPESGLSFEPTLYDPVRGYRTQLDPLKALRTTIYRDLNTNPILRSQYSLLPYLLFSPYSPIKLEIEKEKGHGKHPFPYRDAFQDLILTTHGRSIGSLAYGYFHLFGPTEGPERSWIYYLWADGILQQSGTTSNPDIGAFQTALNCDWPEEEVWPKKLPSRNEESDEDAQTEQEMYERFLRRASSSTGIAEILESLFTDAEGWMNKQLTSLDPAEMKRQLKEFTDLLERKTGDEAEDKKRGDAVKALESLFTQAVGLLEKQQNGTPEGKRKVENFAETKIGKELEGLKRKGAADSKAVFTSTTTEHTTNEDGSVETSVTVWKRYADGRETTTTTSHIEGPACCDDEDESELQSGIAKDPEQKNEDKKSEKKGWFWN